MDERTDKPREIIKKGKMSAYMFVLYFYVNKIK
jgi:hypothetical protein